ncbi:hypothetical protein MRX96_014093 [Rhipicephalus microplus]
MDAYAEELALPTIYMGVPRKIIGPRSTPFAMASSEIRRTDQRGMTPEHVLYMAVKVMQYNVAESNMMFRTNETTGSITREQLESGAETSFGGGREKKKNTDLLSNINRYLFCCRGHPLCKKLLLQLCRTIRTMASRTYSGRSDCITSRACSSRMTGYTEKP